MEESNGQNPALLEQLKKILGCLKLITIEPTMFLYMMAFMITSVVEQAFFKYKACSVDHGYNDEICKSIVKNKTIEADVQVTVSEFHQWNDIASHVIPIILAMFMGNWSDRRGRKMPLLLGLFSKFIYSFMIVINALQPTWNLNMIVYTASLPMALFGADVAIFASCFAYISDISSVEQRILRVTILDVVYLSTMPTGVALGSYLFYDVVNKSYATMFAINAFLLFLAIIYSCVRLQWRTTIHQKSLVGTNVVQDFFDKRHITATVKTLIRSRPSHGKLHVWLLLFSMVLYVFQRDENPKTYLYTQYIFHWDVHKYSLFKTFKSALFVMAMLIGVPMMTKLFKLKDTVIIMIGAASHAIGRVIFALAEVPEMFYVGAAAAALGPIVAPVLRSVVSKIIPAEERGKIFSILSICDNAVPVLSGVLYSQLYNATIHTFPSAIYWLTFSSQVAVMVLAFIIYLTSENNEPCDATNTRQPSISSISEQTCLSKERRKV